MRQKVFLNRVLEYDVGSIVENLRSAYKFLELDETFKKGGSVLLKPNLLSSFSGKKKPVTTDAALIEGIIVFLRELGFEISIGDSPALESVHRVLKKTGILKVCERYGVNVVEFKRGISVKLPDFSVIKRVEVAEEIFEFDHVINIPKLKTHTMMGLTLGVKNMYGAVIGRKKAVYHLNAGEDREIFARMLLGIYKKILPDITILDGIVGMDGNGPSNGESVNTGILAISRSAISIDATISKIINFPDKRNYILDVSRRFYGDECDLNIIEYHPLKPLDFKIEGFKFPTISDLRWRIPPFMANFLRELLSKNLKIDVKKCVKCGRCVDVCPTGAIDLSGKKPEIDGKKCIRCFCCQEICPNDAIYQKK